MVTQIKTTRQVITPTEVDAVAGAAPSSPPPPKLAAVLPGVRSGTVAPSAHVTEMAEFVRHSDPVHSLQVPETAARSLPGSSIKMPPEPVPQLRPSPSLISQTE